MANNFVQLTGKLFKYSETQAGSKTVSKIVLLLSAGRNPNAPKDAPPPPGTFVDVEAWELDPKRAKALNEIQGRAIIRVSEGRLKQDTWEAKDGSKRSKLKVVCNGTDLGVIKVFPPNEKKAAPAAAPAPAPEKPVDDGSDLPF